jgi:hypothetical protein
VREKLKGMFPEFFDEEEEQERAKGYGSEYDQAVYDIEYNQGLPAEFCPVCTFEAMAEHLLFPYLLARFGMTEKEIMDEIRGRFSNYGEFKSYIERTGTKITLGAQRE